MIKIELILVTPKDVSFLTGLCGRRTVYPLCPGEDGVGILPLEINISVSVCISHDCSDSYNVLHCVALHYDGLHLSGQETKYQRRNYIPVSIIWRTGRSFKKPNFLGTTEGDGSSSLSLVCD